VSQHAVEATPDIASKAFRFCARALTEAEIAVLAGKAVVPDSRAGSEWQSLCEGQLGDHWNGLKSEELPDGWTVPDAVACGDDCPTISAQNQEGSL